MRFPSFRPRSGQDAASSTRVPPDVSQEMAALRVKYLGRIREDHEVLSRLCAATSPTPELVSIVHKLAGSAALVGYPEISEIAGRLDDEFAEPGANPSLELPALLRVLEATLAREGVPRD